MHRLWLAGTVMACALLVSPASEAGQRARPAGTPSSGQAVSRGSGGSSSSGSGGGSTAAPAPSPAPRSTPSTAGSSGGRHRSATSGDSGSSRAVPRGERPRNGRTVIGTAVPRTHPPQTGGGGGVPINHFWLTRPSYWYGYGAAGLGYFYYDPFWWGVPYAGYGYYGGYPYGAYPYGGYPYGGYSYGGGYDNGGYDSSAYDLGVGKLRLKVEPRDAEVYVDGQYVGVVTNFDGVFQRLELNAGAHKVEIRKDGFETLSIEVKILPDETTTYEGELKPRGENKLP